jgi:hypothetical protein
VHIPLGTQYQPNSHSTSSEHIVHTLPFSIFSQLAVLSIKELLRLLVLFLLQSEERLFVVTGNNAAASLALEVLEALRAAEPVAS